MRRIEAISEVTWEVGISGKGGLTPISGSLKFSLTVFIRSKHLYIHWGVHAVPGQVHLCRETPGLSVVLKSNDCFLHWVLVQGMHSSIVRAHSSRLGWMMLDVEWYEYYGKLKGLPRPGVIPFSPLVPFHLMACTGAKNQSKLHTGQACVLFCGGVFKKPTQPESIQHKNAIIERI